MEIREVRVEVKKMVSDGNYGHEVYTVAVTATIDEEETWNESAHRLATQAYDIVLAHLKDSRSDGVRQALETRAEREARWDRERAEGQAVYDRERAQRQRQDDDPDEADADGEFQGVR